jgi:hypothetical protein
VWSNAWQRWSGERRDALTEIREAHRSVGGRGRGRRYATLQLNHAYATLLSSQFQGYCRDLHTEVIDHLAGEIPVAALDPVIAGELSDWRNAIGHQDFSKVGGDSKLTLVTVRGWHASLDGLAKDFDRAVKTHITGLAGSSPW